MPQFVLASILATLLAVSLIGCNSNQTTVPPTDAEWERQNRQYQDQLDAADEQITRGEEFDRRSKSQQERMDQLLKRYEEQTDRYDKILDRWEKQQTPEK